MARVFRAVGIVFFGGVAVAAGSYPRPPFAKQPLRFEDHAGEFIARGPSYVLTVQAKQNVLAWINPKTKAAATLTTPFPGANREATLLAETIMAGVSNYFIGNSPRDWRTGVANYREGSNSEYLSGNRSSFLRKGWRPRI